MHRLARRKHGEARKDLHAAQDRRQKAQNELNSAQKSKKAAAREKLSRAILVVTIVQQDYDNAEDAMKTARDEARKRSQQGQRRRR